MPKADELIPRLTSALPRDLLLDLLDMSTARALQAHEVIRDHTDLKGKNARGAEGQVRFRLMEKGFQDVCELHGGIALAGGLLPGTELNFYQPFMRFEGDRGGVVLALASMPGRRELPTKNQSRASGVTLNYHLTPRLCLDASDPKPGDIFVLLLVARDPARSGKVDEIAIGAIDSNYSTYLFYETVEAFMANYVIISEPKTAPEAASAAEAKPSLVKLKAARKPFKPPEAPNIAGEGQSDNKA
ncbi:hypothetical protein [Methylobacterium persicinum]|uniref:Uncharacterized protein n=1 Tax=Methylobacterium persicinum TaxID=374426 RepID=A0ABU0HT03_9HYPH|nr:hypothetical protein [Methylobacterium persicinum]MDQ0445477.1 hypothetical protein [Methylobacterium persicinum]GJE40251.1 hypothetical protein KHHGKMAE_4342 [Methylobacterium persicinum]